MSGQSVSPDRCLHHLLMDAAEYDPPRRLIIYPPANTTTPDAVTYHDLFVKAWQLSSVVRGIPPFRNRRPVLLHFDNIKETIFWFWGVVLAGGLPVPSTPFPNGEEHRRKHIQSLSRLLESPICITSAILKPLFDQVEGIQIATVESLLDQAQSTCPSEPPQSQPSPCSDGTAVLMLTSGSTGDSKAVRLGHKQILAAVAGKASVRQLPRDRPFLNWIGMGHVASLVEIHLQALFLNVDQVHAHTSDVVASPEVFIDLLDRHKISRSFAPNFFLAKLVSSVQPAREEDPTAQSNGQLSIELDRPNSGHKTWDLSSLAVLASGGEANDIQTCIAASALLEKYGAPPNVITPGFGMTETCAGAIFNLDCPRGDLENDREISSLGKCMRGIEMRVTRPENAEGAALALVDQPGSLEVRGDVLFEGYYNDPEATRTSFSADGWFRTGDTASIDSFGNLNLTGRSSDVLNINGVKYSCTEAQSSLERIDVIRTHVDRLVVFPSRPPRAPTEQVTVAFVPKTWPMQSAHIADLDGAIVSDCVFRLGSRPLVYAVKDESQLPASVLGKVSKTKMKLLFETGCFDQDVRSYHGALEASRSMRRHSPRTAAETQLLDDFRSVLDTKADLLGVETPFFDFGITSMDLIRLKRRMDNRLQVDVPVIALMRNPTVRTLAPVLENLACQQQSPGHDLLVPAVADPAGTSYDPVVTFRPGGSKAPLWLIHPGVGEVLVFVGLAQQLAENDRPVYALRARGFEPGQGPFSSVAEAVETYHDAIQQRQPSGPYAIAGYSYGAMLAFEVTKSLERVGGAVKFLGCFNLPPHIKPRMRQLSWNMCLLHLAYFLGLTTESYAHAAGGEIRNLHRQEAMEVVLGAANQGRMDELGLDRFKLANWADLAFGLQSMAVDYEPQGLVDVIDVFHAIPLQEVARSRDDWLQNHLGKWNDFSRTEPKYHAVGGAHYTMLGPNHVGMFAVKLKAAMEARGV